MNWLVSFGLLEIVTIWVSISILVIATVWYAATIIPSYWPSWWKHYIVADFPEGYDQKYF